jgi:osmotically-inducible protein OsmY
MSIAADRFMTAKTDQEIQRDVFAELSREGRIAPNELGISVMNGIVTLSGHVDSFYKQWAAEDAAQSVRGVKAVVNELEIVLPDYAERSDEEIARSAVQAIESDVLLADLPLHITVGAGWVTITGDVEWNYLKEDAEAILRRLFGVQGVTNLVTVKMPPTPIEQKSAEDHIQPHR